MFHVELSLNMAAESLSVFFPEQLAEKVVAHISTFPRGVVGSHGLGMVSGRNQTTLWRI